MTDLPVVTVSPPPANKPGFMRRQIKIMELQARVKTGEPGSLMAMLEFIAAECEVTAPDGVAPIDALLDLSELQFDEIFMAVSGQRKTVPPVNGALSATGSAE